MKTRKRVLGVTVGICLFWISAAHAENWVRVVNNPGGNTTYRDVDVDSIRKDADGLVYYSQRDDWDYETNAFDCQKHIKYSVDYWKRYKKDWRSYPLKIDGITIDVENFVCSRAR